MYSVHVCACVCAGEGAGFAGSDFTSLECNNPLPVFFFFPYCNVLRRENAKSQQKTEIQEVASESLSTQACCAKQGWEISALGAPLWREDQLMERRHRKKRPNGADLEGTGGEEDESGPQQIATMEILNGWR